MPKRKEKVVEILAPGKNLFYAKEAIKCGADSIYIGAPKFSLRHEHGNNMQDIKELVEYAHKYWVNVYIPLNCLLFTDEDIANAKAMIQEFYEMGVDGLIIEVHNSPETALCDGAQSLFPEDFAKLFDELKALAKVVNKKF